MLTDDEEAILTRAMGRAIGTLSRPRSASEVDLDEALRAAEKFAELARSIVTTEKQMRALPGTMA